MEGLFLLVPPPSAGWAPPPPAAAAAREGTRGEPRLGFRGLQSPKWRRPGRQRDPLNET
jgi:hypothetical protein